jgi:hypothetical protein
MTGCGGYGAICADAMDCAGGNDADIEACEIDAQAAEDSAGVAQCDEEFADYHACVEDKSTCVDRHFTDRGYCDREAEDLSLCMDKNLRTDANNGAQK